MGQITRREVMVALPAVAAAGVGAAGAQSVPSHASEFPAPQSAGAADQTARPAEKPGAAVGVGTGVLKDAGVFAFDAMHLRTMANGGESRDIAHGLLATGESVNLHQSMQPAGLPPNPAHVIKHSEFILVREGELEFQHELDGKMVADKAGPGGVIYVAFGTKHAVRNVGDGPARYFVVAIGGDAK